MALSVKEMTFTESPQEENYSENALDKVVDPCTEFQVGVIIDYLFIKYH